MGEDDLLDRIVGRLIVVDKVGKDSPHKIKNNATYYCLCECGGFAYVPASYLRNSKTTHCGCIPLKRNTIDLTGQKFHKLTVTGRSTKKRSGKTLWTCNCDCGKVVHIPSYNLRNGITQSCGCSRRVFN